MKRTLLLVAAVCLMSGSAFADLVYTGHRVAGTATADLSIRTDGTIGVLSGANILDWTIVLNDAPDTFTLFGPLSGSNSALFLSGSVLSATPTDLVFDFDAAAGFALFQSPAIGSSQLFYCPQINGCYDFAGPGEAIDAHTNFNFQSVAQRGQVTLASTGQSVPEPATLLLLGLGCALLAAQRRRQRS